MAECPARDGPDAGEAFPLDALPLSLAELAAEGAAAFGCPPDYFAAPALALAGGAMGRSVELSVNSTYTEAADLTIAVVGPPGSKKSPALRVMLKPFFEIDRELRDVYLQEKETYKRQLREWEARKKGADKAAERGDEPVMPTHGHLTLDDTTRESVCQVHAQNARGVVVAMDELSAWVASLNAYRSGKGDDRQFWLKVRSGSLVKVTRKGAPEPLVIHRPMVPVVGCLTPSGLPDIAHGRDDGWMDRILFAYPEAGDAGRSGYIDKQIDPDLLDAWEGAVRRLRGRPMNEEKIGHPRPFFVHMTKEARASWAAFVNAHHAEQRQPGFDESLIGPWSKLEGFTLRLALILSQLRWAYDATSEGQRAPDVTTQDIEGAVRLSAYLKSHFRRVRAELSGAESREAEDGEEILKWAAREGRNSFSANQINEAMGRFRGNLKRRDAALAWLRSRSAIRPLPAPIRDGPGRSPSPVFEINPRIRRSGYSGNGPPGAEAGDSLNILNGSSDAGSDRDEGGDDA